MNPTVIWLFCTFLSIELFLASTEAATCRHASGKVEVIDETLTGAKSISSLEVNSTILPKHVVCTGRGSRTELREGDAIIRFGSNTVAQQKSKSTYWIHSGSLLFCSTKPTIVTFSSLESSATFHGRGTIILETTGNGGFKLIPLEVQGHYVTEQGGKKKARAAQLMFVIDKPSKYGDAYDIDLMLMLRSSRLLGMFPDPLPTFERIGLAIYSQELRLKGKYNALIGDAPNKDTVQLWAFEKSQGFESGSKNENRKPSSSKRGFFGRIFGGNRKK